MSRSTRMSHFFKSSLSLLFLLITIASGLSAQTTGLTGLITTHEGAPLSFANVSLKGTSIGDESNTYGKFTMAGIRPGTYTLSISYLGYDTHEQEVTIQPDKDVHLDISLIASHSFIDEVVVTGTMKQVNRLDSPVPVDVYNQGFFKKNPTSNMFEALTNVNGVRPQVNCNVCNTGDIRINGLEGPYTMILIDGMPIVSSLASVYGLSGIPNSIIERMEVVKGPASSLYGSEAIGGLINIITKSPEDAAAFSVDVMGTSWGELSLDLSTKFHLGKTASVLTGGNYHNFDQVIDNNDDNFTDLALQRRLSVFQKWDFHRKDQKLTSLGARYYWEDRWGGETRWTPADRGSSSVYGEAITTKRWELIGQYQLPTSDNIMLSASVNGHNQDAFYGDEPYVANQFIGFSQLTWNKTLDKHDLLVGTALRYTFYDDNTPATGGGVGSEDNNPDHIWLPGIFIQDEITFSKRQKLLLGVRYDYNDDHGSILTPRIAYKWSLSDTDILRINAGTGFRVVNLFTEEHAALTGAREVIIASDLSPERSINANVNYTKKIYADNGSLTTFELSGWYTHFDNVILPDYDTNPNQIIYDNLDGRAVTQGVSFNTNLSLSNGLSVLAGATYQDVSTIEQGIKSRQLLTERFTGTWTVSYPFLDRKISVDYTGNVYSPMDLPLLGELDPRPAQSPWWSIQNIQISYKRSPQFEIYGGVKNLFNWTPWKNSDEPIIARSFDPFDKGVEFDSAGEVVPTPSNPHALTFDPIYVYAPNQGIRGFLGIRYSW